LGILASLFEVVPDKESTVDAYDQFGKGVQEIADMPEQKVDLLHKFPRQHNGQLSKRARTNEFGALTSEEVERVEALYRDAF
jgi:hypothetical protein